MVSKQSQFDALVRATSGDLYRFAFWLCGNEALAHDLTQETYLRAWRSLDNLRETAAAKAWLITILRREHARLYERKTPAFEPIDAVDITVSDDYVGAVMSDLRGRRGQVLGTEPARESGWTIVHAEVPQTELSRYPIDLRSVSHGTGSFTRSMLRYDYMPAEKAKEYAKAE